MVNKKIISPLPYHQQQHLVSLSTVPQNCSNPRLQIQLFLALRVSLSLHNRTPKAHSQSGQSFKSSLLLFLSFSSPFLCLCLSARFSIFLHWSSLLLELYRTAETW